MTWTHFDFHVSEGVGRLTFNRPQTLNSITFDVYRDLVRLTAELPRDPSCRVLVLAGQGKGFCSGGDINLIMGPLLQASTEEVLAFTHMTCDVVRNLRTMPQPVIAAVHGNAAGAGAVIALASDLRVCTPDAKFAFLFTKVGLAGADMGAAWMLPRVIGAGRAAEVLLFGDPVPAEQALAWGLANRVVPADQLEETVMTWALHLAHGPQEALHTTKRALVVEADMSLAAALEYEAAAQAVLLRGRDHAEFFKARHEKRPPQWHGSHGVS